jgi:DNA topoisomerase-1
MTTKVPLPGAYAAAVGARSTKPSRRASTKSYKEESDDEFDVPPSTNMASQDEQAGESASDSSDDEPLVKKTATPKRASNGTNGKATNGKAKSTKKRKKSENASEDDEDTEMEKPAKKAKQPPKKRVKKEVKQEMSDDEPLSKTSPKKKDAKPKKPKKEEPEEEVFKWWEQETPDDIEGDGSKKWDSLQHAGVLFPPPYIPLPSSVKMMYDGQPVDLPPEPEEVAGFFAAMLDTDHAQNDVFQANFFKDWLAILNEHPPVCVRLLASGIDG